MNRLSRLLLMLVLLFPCSASAARIYRLVDYPDLQNGHSLNGTITTTDDAPNDSVLETQEILEWRWEITGPSSFSALSSDFTLDRTNANNVRITASVIDLPLGASETDHEVLSLGRLEPSQSGREGGLLHSITWFFQDGIRILRASFREGDAVSGFWNDESASVDNSFAIASTIPEPSSLLLAITCFLTLLSTPATRC